MLGRSYETALPFAEDLVRKGVVLSTAPSSPLGELCRWSVPLEPQDEVRVPSGGDTKDQISGFGYQLDYHSTGDAGAQWGAAYDNSVEGIGGVLQQNINYIKNTIIPRTSEFAKDADQFIRDLTSSDPSKELCIERGMLPELVQESFFLELLEQFKGRNPVKPHNYSLLFPFSSAPEDFLTVASLSNGRLDSMVAEWAKNCDTNWLQSAWYSFFAGDNVNREVFKGPYLSEDDMRSPNPYVRVNTSLAYYLLAQYYVTHLPDIVTQESRVSIERRLRDHLEYAAITLVRALNNIVESNESNLLVANIDEYHKKITVSAEIYDRYLAAGGSTEIILGILVGGRQFYTVSDIEANREILQKAWDHYQVVHLEGIEYVKAHELRKFYFALFCQYYTADYREAIEDSYLLSRPGYQEAQKAAVQKLLESMRKEELCNVQKIAKELIAGHKYGFTYAKPFMCDMEEIGLNVDGVVPEEAAFMATINYIADWILGQIQANKV